MTKPLILMCSTPVSGHIIPMRTLAKQLIVRGYAVCFVTSSGYRQYIEDTGASFVAVQGYGDFYDLRARDLDPNWSLVKDSLIGPENFAHDVVHVFCKSITSQHAALQKALKMLKDKHPGRPIVLLTESLNFGALPLTLGAPGLRPNAFIAIGLNPVFLTSIGHPPFGLGLLPDNSEEGQQRNRVANEAHKHVLAEAQAAFAEALQSVGAKQPDTFLLDALYSLPDRFVQMCTPSVEYHRIDAPKTLRFAGGYPQASRDLMLTKPPWWNEVTSNTTKKVVFVCQGTVARNLSHLAIPTMVTLKDRSDILVIVSLGVKGDVLPPNTEVPPNARVADYIPYDDLLPYCDIFVTTGGYGSFQRALNHGVPLIMAATSEEKPETAARAEWAGVAVNLRSSQPSIEQIQQAVEKILLDRGYKSRAMQIKSEIEAYDPVGVVIANVEELAELHV